MKDNVLRKKTDFETLKGSISSVHVLKESKKTKQELDAVATIGLCVGDVYYVEAMVWTMLGQVQHGMLLNIVLK